MVNVVLLNEVRAGSFPLRGRLNNLRTGQSFSLVPLTWEEE